MSMAQLVRAPAHRAGDPGSNPGPDEKFSLKLLIKKWLDEWFVAEGEDFYCAWYS